MPRVEGINKNKSITEESNKRLEEVTLSDNTQVGSGIACTAKTETIPEFVSAECEKVITNANSFIVLGRDRPSSRLSGYGGIGAVASHTIDLVVGRKAPGATPGQRTFVDPDFFTDSARIYIAERTDVDSNFRLVDGSNGPSINRSAIALKSDAVRIIAEDGGIKLVTNTAGRNSNGRLVSVAGGVELIAGNDDTDLQSMVKGENLVEVLKSIIEQISTLNGSVANMSLAMTLFEIGLIQHVHPGPGVPSPNLASFAAQKIGANTTEILQSITQNVNLAAEQLEYLSGFAAKSILSIYHKVN
jgi:hypothetical protein